MDKKDAQVYCPARPEGDFFEDNRLGYAYQKAGTNPRWNSDMRETGE